MKKNRKRKSVGRGGQSSRRRRAHEDHDDHGPAREKVLRGPGNVELPPEDASETELAGDVRVGRVVSIRGTEIRVEPPDGGEGVATSLRKSTRVPHPRASAVVVGDLVRYLAEGDEPFVLTAVEPRRSHLTRIRRGREEHVICANADLGVMIASAVDPPFKPRLVDRYLISFQDGGLTPVLVLNKIDLLEGVSPASLLEPYRALPFARVAVSAVTGEGLDELREVLKGAIAVFAGQSGVGKSSLLNKLGGLDLRTQDVQDWTGKGRHTTTHSTMYPFPFGGAVIDTPGVRSFGLHAPTEQSLREFFPEVYEAAEECRFRDCSHDGDDGCAVPAAIASGAIAPERLDSFRTLLDVVRGK
ncbi:ribosome small subunit-dependent GTPase A [bacterium]|nr:ribosome small subunit-dependent GTPase A [bacterium]